MQEDRERIESWIDSCTNLFQLKCCYNAIELFKTKHGSDSAELEGELLEILIRKRELIQMAI